MDQSLIPIRPAPLSPVKLHVRNVLTKLNLSSRVEAAVYAVRHDLRKGKQS